MSGGAPERWIRLYRALCDRLLPRAYREVAGAEMIRLARDLLTEARRAGWLRFWMRWIELHADLLVTAVAVRRLPPLIGDLGLDLRVALRRLARSPGYALTVVVILVLGIGVNTAVFQSINSVLFRPLPYRTADRLVALNPVFDAGGSPSPRMSPRMARDVARLTSTLDAVAMMDDGAVALTADGPAELVRAGWASTDFFRVLGVEARSGRVFVPSDGEADRQHVAVVSDGLWTRVLGRDPDAVGRSLTLDGATYRIVGVLPADFEDPTGGGRGFADVWLPIAPRPGDALYDATWVTGIGLLEEGVTLGEAQREIDAVAARLPEVEPDAYPEGVRVLVTGLQKRVWGDVTSALGILLGAAGLVLLIACANLAGLVLARAAERAPEVAVRSALGAGRLRIARQVFVESLVLALVGGVGGVALAGALQQGVSAYLGGQIPRLANAETDARVLAFALVVSVGTAVLFGWMPGWRTARAEPSDVLRESRRGTSAGRRKRRLRSGLVVGQMAVSVALLVGATLMVRSLGELLAVDPGFEPERALTFELRLPSARYETTESVLAFQSELLKGLGGVPGVRSVGAVDKRPLGTRWGCEAVMSDEMPVPDTPESWPCSESRAATPDYFDAMGIERVAGRSFEVADGPEAPPVVIVNETLARRFWPRTAAVGRRLRWWSDVDQGRPWRTVVGVVEDVKHRGLAAEVQPEIYMPHGQAPDRRMTFVLRTDGDPARLLPLSRLLVARLDPDLPLRDAMTMHEVVRSNVADQRIAAALLGGLAFLAVVLSLAGVHGAMVSLVSQRTREIGVRVTLGATRHEVLRMVLGRSTVLAGVALLTGLPLAFLVGLLLESTLYRVGPLDPGSLAAAASAVVATALLASALPARRALRVDPVEALRQE